MKRVSILLCALLMVMGLSISAHATLVDMNDGTIYDTDTQLSWLKNANYANTSGYSTGFGGRMTWVDANTWAASLNAGGGFAGLTGWRLPNADPGCGVAFNCTNSEMGHLYYTELGNAAGGPLTNKGPFTSVQADDYWPGTEYAPLTSDAWVFNFYDGSQGVNSKDGRNYAWAVRSGARSVGSASPVPATGTMGLIVIGLAGLGVIFYSRKKRTA
jgi:hypothetical protein